MKFQLPSSVCSAQDLSALELEIREYSRWFSHNAIKERVHAKQGVAHPALSPGAIELIRSWNTKGLLSAKSLDELVVAINAFRTSAPTLTITLAAPPANDLKHTLVEWCRTNVESNVLVSFQFNATLLGGMVVRYGSHVFDWTFKRQLLASRHNFPEVLRRV